jgi:hypothetical protein
MVVVTQAVPSNEHSVHVRPVDPSSSSILFEVSIYLVRHIRSFANDPAGDTIFDPALCPLPRWAVATFYALYGVVVVYTNVVMLYHVTTLIRRIIFRQPAWQWPPLPAARGRPHRSRMSGASAGTGSPARIRRLQHATGAPRGATGRIRGITVMQDLGMFGLGGTVMAPSAGSSSSWASGQLRNMGSRGLLGVAWVNFGAGLWTLGWGVPMINGWARRGPGMVSCDHSPTASTRKRAHRYHNLHL